MNKKYWMVAWMLMIVSILSGCACNHEWVDADCINPRTCAACNETEGEALGHAYDKWEEMNKDKMVRTCVKCDTAEVKDIDREVILNEQILGSWDSEYVRNEENRLDFDGYRYTFFDDHTFVWSSDTGKKVEGEWNYYDYTEGVSKGYIIGLESTVNGEDAIALLVQDDKYVVAEITEEYQTYYIHKENVETIKEKVQDAAAGPKDENFKIRKNSEDIKRFEDSMDDIILFHAARMIGARLPDVNIEHIEKENIKAYNVTSKGNSLIGVGFLDASGEFIDEKERVPNHVALVYVKVYPDQKDSKWTKGALMCLMLVLDENLSAKDAERILMDLQDGLEKVDKGELMLDGNIFSVQKNDVYYWVDASDESFFAISLSPIGDII